MQNYSGNREIGFGLCCLQKIGLYRPYRVENRSENAESGLGNS
jgi:hypothetical protein